MKELLEQLLSEAHPKATLPPALREKMVLDLAIQLEQLLFASIADDLTPEQGIQLSSALTPPVDQPAAEAILNQVPNYQERLLSVYQKFREDYLRICQQ